MQEFKQLMLGELSIPTYLAAFIFSLLAIALSMLVSSLSRDKFSPATPVRFSLTFLIKDNSKRIAAGLIIIFLFYRFAPTLINKPLSMEAAVGIGFFLSFGLDQVLGFLKKKFSILQVDREKIIDKLNQNK